MRVEGLRFQMTIWIRGVFEWLDNVHRLCSLFVRGEGDFITPNMKNPRAGKDFQRFSQRLHPELWRSNRPMEPGHEEITMRASTHIATANCRRAVGQAIRIGNQLGTNG